MVQKDTKKFQVVEEIGIAALKVEPPFILQSLKGSKYGVV